MGQLDTGYGPWFGDTDGDEDDGGKVSEEVLEYLRSVNSEAVKLGPLSTRNASRLPNPYLTNAYFDDDAVVSLVGPKPIPARFRTLADAQEHFLLKSMLRARAALRTGTATTNALGPAPTRTKLREHMIARDAGAPELRNMARETQLNAVRELTERLAWPALAGASEGRRLQGWLFGVLARLEDAGALFIDDVDAVRLLGKRALRVAIDQVRAIEKGVEQMPEDPPERAPKRQKTALAADEAVPIGKHAQIDGSNDDAAAAADAMSMSDGEVSDSRPMSICASPNPDSKGHNKSKKENEHNNHMDGSEPIDSDSDMDKNGTNPYALPAAPPSSTGSAFASLDMVLTVVGRVYRQGDLLEKKRSVFAQVRY